MNLPMSYDDDVTKSACHKSLTLHCTGSEITGFVRGGAFRRHLVEDASGGHFWGQIHW